MRLQVGWQNEHPIVITCGKCGTSLSGHVTIGQDTLGLGFEFENATIINDDDYEDYLVECSGEFPVVKQCKVQNGERDVITPFIRTMNRMKDDESYEIFCKSVSQLNKTAEKWKDYKRILDLFQNKSDYVVQEIKKTFEGEYFQCRDESEVLRAVHMIEVHGFYSSLKRELLDNLSFSSNILKLDRIQMKKMIEFLNMHDGYHLEEIQSLVYKLLGEFIDVYQALVPVLALQYCKDDSIDFEFEGSTTSTYNTVKQFYLDAYEALGNLLIIPVALNNIRYRSNFDKLTPIEPKAVSMEDFIGLTKAKRYHFCLKDEVYTDFLGITVNPKLRNAIGHNDVNYNTASQLITYIPNPKDRTKKETEYLLEFENEAVHLFQGILAISEYLYRLRELELILDGKVPIMSRMPISKPQKIGRNEPCSCGSGKKYKFCHGRS
ncbi:SEC-C metal-binding domain-containing protein [[Clostridium] fimetarium]|uniref:SEC-C metal-binding domain-containing protein n=1 Tax=[Clostridium] fimetarium TaxID=99656 RepID=UPI001FA84304|nr:SEC-C metal-binding domain-containing protein [[Clostridium] fimetarium]